MAWDKITLEEKCEGQLEMDEIVGAVQSGLSYESLSDVGKIEAHKTLHTRQIGLVNGDDGQSFAVGFERIVDGDVDYVDYVLEIKVYTHSPSRADVRNSINRVKSLITVGRGNYRKIIEVRA